MESSLDTTGEDYYKAVADSYTKCKNLEHRQAIEVPNYMRLLERVNIGDKDVIDLACGSGYYTRILRERVLPPHDVWGADISENMINIAKEFGPDTIKYVVQDCTEPLPEGKQFDVVSATFLI